MPCPSRPKHKNFLLGPVFLGHLFFRTLLAWLDDTARKLRVGLNCQPYQCLPPLQAFNSIPSQFSPSLQIPESKHTLKIFPSLPSPFKIEQR